MSHALATGSERRGLMAACLLLGAADLAFIDAVALPRVMGRPSVGTPSREGHPPPTPPAARGERSALLPREAGEVGRGSPSHEDAPRAPTIVPTPALELTIHFTTADATLAPRARAAIDELAAGAAAHGGWSFIVNGHADARGEADFNVRLSELRAAAVAARLEAAGIPVSRLRTTAYGASRPLATGEDRSSLRRNRRAEILIVRGAP
jgi:peptidoglycan-associated lipoprotein